MAAAGIAGLLRSAATKLAHPPAPQHRRLAAPRIHGRYPGFSRCSCRPAGSNNKATRKNEKIASNLDSTNKTMMKMSCFMMFGAIVYMYGYVIPTMDRNIAASSARSKRDAEYTQAVRHECEKIRNSSKEHSDFLKSLLEASNVLTNNSQVRSARTPGNGMKRGVGDF